MNTSETFHPLTTTLALPSRLNSPFCYVPHPLCLQAAAEVEAYLERMPLLAREAALGKMMGVLVCETSDARVGFLAAYSGQMGGREDWPWFVPAVYDYLQPHGLFKQKEAHIDSINRQIDNLKKSPELLAMRQKLLRMRTEAKAETEAYRLLMADAKKQRDANRQAASGSEEERVAESQFQKAELRRLKQRWQERISNAEEEVKPTENAIAQLCHERKVQSEALQSWLFDQFEMLNAKGERRTLTEIFRHVQQTSPHRQGGGVPPAGAGECCAPKLLQYAFLHHLRPVAMAEFWHGASPKMEVRHHGHFYPACRGKCKPILEWMLGTEVCDPERAPYPFAAANQQLFTQPPSLLYKDSCLLVIDKPSGLLSVPGLTGEPSVESLLRNTYGEVYMVHRLDQDTSGLMVVARTMEAYHHLQRQFLARTIHKKYIALLDGDETVHGDKLVGTGTINLPLRPDLHDRPRQMVDAEHGKEAVTDYEVLTQDSLPTLFGAMETQPGHHYTLVALTPHTGRTHQLRVHCAHADGLGCPIVGDGLYGKPAQRLCLHAAELAFCHPLTGKRMVFSCL